MSRVYAKQVHGAFMDDTTTLRQKGRALRLFITCKADVRALQQGLKEPRALSVFTDHEDLGDRKKRKLNIDPQSLKMAPDRQGYLTTYYNGAPVSVVPRSDGDGFELVFPSTRKGEAAERRFTEHMEPLPLQRAS